MIKFTICIFKLRFSDEMSYSDANMHQGYFSHDAINEDQLFLTL